jgi:quercetin dioxygenase-like cupin family protein
VQTQIPSIENSALALSTLRVEPEAAVSVADAECDTLLYTFGGAGLLALGGETFALGRGTAALVLAGEEGTLAAERDGLAVVRAIAGPDADRHASLGNREVVVRVDEDGSEAATGARSFQVLFGPPNGSTRATLFAGFVPPGRAPWHYHLYDEIVWVPEGPGRLHLRGATTDLGPGSAFRLRPRQVHIVENASADRPMTVIGVFTPAGSPSAAYLTPEVAAEYRYAG